MKKSLLLLLPIYIALTLLCGAATAQAIKTDTPSDLIKSITADVIDTIKREPAIQQGDMGKISQLVNQKILPYADVEYATRLTMGPNWQKATPQQQQQLMTQFKDLLFYIYAGAIAQVRDQQINYEAPVLFSQGERAMVRAKVSNQGRTIRIDYWLRKTDGQWKVYDILINGASIIQTYRGQFKDLVSERGLDGLIASLKGRNQQLASGRRP